ncbi:protein of unknown function [Moritella yayanosii]|uniref:Uncharacterized protein n=1 Tax=Moritella yayanosii TaxID=69539 RepID=A0A330LLN9_9GAMM|nr:protein of unknown function [Moritella yayanosii]
MLFNLNKLALYADNFGFYGVICFLIMFCFFTFQLVNAGHKVILAILRS